jgi:site-specific DNA-methyltransferase (adenine-specific)
MTTKLTIEYRKTSELIPYARNSRTHSEEQVAQIAASIQEFGFTNPVLIDEKGIIAGHGRIMGARKLGMEEVPTITLHGLTESQRKAYIIADNRLALNAGWDDEMLRLEIADLKEDGFDLDLLGFEDDELAALEVEIVEGETDPDEVPEPPSDPVSVLGDVWTLGNHRLMCGDSTSIDAVNKLMDGKKADCLWTDPPYGVSYVGKTKDALTIENDSLDDDSLTEFLREAFNTAILATEGGAAWYVAAPPGPLHQCFSLVLKELGVWRQTLNWIKSSVVFGRSDYHYQHEPIFYGWNPSGSHKWTADRKQTTVLNFDKPSRNGEHPTMKPVELVEYCVGNNTNKGDLVLDLFGGSGTTMMACEKSGRRSRLMELAPNYCDVIVKRWQDFTGKKAVHESSKTFDEMASSRGK